MIRRIVYSLLAQVGYWAGRWVGRREAKAALKNHRETSKYY